MITILIVLGVIAIFGLFGSTEGRHFRTSDERKQTRRKLGIEEPAQYD